MSEIDDTLASLGLKLDRLDLTDGERTALQAIFEAAGDDEALGFAKTSKHGGVILQRGEVIPWGTYMPKLANVVESRICPSCGSLAEACWCVK